MNNMKKFNRLKYAKVYLCGSMDADRVAGAQWRQEITPFLESLGCIVFNPYKKDVVDNKGFKETEDDNVFAIMQELQKEEKYDELKPIIKSIRQSDLRMVDHSDVMVAYLDFSKRLCGSWEEYFIGNKNKRPILTFSNVPKKEMPLWLFDVVPHELLFNNIDEVKEYMRHIHEDEVIDSLGRWVFFDLEEKIRQIK